MNNISIQPLIQDLLPFVVTALGALITALAGFAVALLKQKTGIALSQQTLQVFETAAEAQAGKWVAAQAGSAWANASINVGNPEIAAAANLVISRLPEEAAQIGVTPDKMADLITGKIGALQAQALGAKQ